MLLAGIFGAMASVQIWNVACVVMFIRHLYVYVGAQVYEWLSPFVYLYVWVCVCLCTIWNGGLGWTAATKSNKNWWFSCRSSITMLNIQMTHVTKNGCKSFHRHIARVQYDDEFSFMIVCTVYTYSIGTQVCVCIHNLFDSNMYYFLLIIFFRLFYEILGNIRFCLLVCLFQLISLSWLRRHNKHKHARIHTFPTRYRNFHFFSI